MDTETYIQLYLGCQPALASTGILELDIALGGGIPQGLLGITGQPKGAFELATRIRDHLDLDGRPTRLVEWYVGEAVMWARAAHHDSVRDQSYIIAVVGSRDGHFPIELQRAARILLRVDPMPGRVIETEIVKCRDRTCDMVVIPETP